MLLRKIYAGLLVTVIAFCGCGPKPSAPQDAIATVNGTPIPAQDLKKELAIRQAQDPSFKIDSKTTDEQLAIMINRRLLIEEAIHRKLAEQDGFKTSIRLYWEQTLIRLLLDDLTREFEHKVNASNNEVSDYYKKLDTRVSFEILRSKDKALVDKALVAGLKGAPVEWGEKTGPVTYDQINSEILEQAFGMGVGEFKIFEKDNLFYLVRVAAREAVTPPPLDSIREKVVARIKQVKQREAFDAWMKEKKKNADIKVYESSPTAPAH